MKQKIVVTNLRIPEENYFQIKTSAAEMGMSVNEYMNMLVEVSFNAIPLGVPMHDAIKKRRSRGRRDPIWELGNLHKKIKRKPMGEFSEEDKIIYG